MSIFLYLIHNFIREYLLSVYKKKKLCKIIHYALCVAQMRKLKVYRVKEYAWTHSWWQSLDLRALDS